MLKDRIKLSNIIFNQLPNYIKDEYPLIGEFLSQYYLAQEYQGAPIDLITNIDQYIKIDNISNLNKVLILKDDIKIYDSVISIDPTKSPNGTNGFPDSYGLLKINDEIITYTEKTDFSFLGCIRGFSGISSLRQDLNNKELLFESTNATIHKSQSEIYNLSCLFLNQFLQKVKVQLTPGLDGRKLHDDLNESTFIKYSKDFYLSRGTDRAFEILFKVLYNEDVKIVKPFDNVIIPSNSEYEKVKSIVVEAVSGDPLELIDRTLYQNEFNSIKKAHAPVVSVEKVNIGVGITHYKLDFDIGYNRDIGLTGSVYGEFSVHSKTKIIGNVSSGSTSLTVDSTVGFECPGELYVSYYDNTVGIVSYTSKSLNQFFNCTNILKSINDGSNVGINTYAESNDIKVRINSVLSDVYYNGDKPYYEEGEFVKIETLGIVDKSPKVNDFFYNISPKYKVLDIILIDSINYEYRINLNVDHCFKLKDRATISLNDGTLKECNISSVISSKSITIIGQGEIKISKSNTFTIKRVIAKTHSTHFNESSIYTTDIQNVYRSIEDSNKYLIASSSIPNYKSQNLDVTNRSVKFSGTFSGNIFKITDTLDHGFYTGDEVYYLPEKEEVNITDDDGQDIIETSIKSSLFDGLDGGEGVYFVTRISPTEIKLSKSRSNINNSIHTTLNGNKTIYNNILIPSKLKFKNLQSQKILRELSLPNTTENNIRETSPGFTGILINGVDILNYKSIDSVKYGSIKSINVISGGFDFNLIDPPKLNITDDNGSGAKGFLAISGALSEIRILDKGNDYQETPTITISGGNGTGAKAKANMRSISHIVPFNSRSTILDQSKSTIGFSTYHNLKNSEEVIYKSGGQLEIGGISSENNYFISIVDDHNIKLHNTKSDSVAGINTITLSTLGNGTHNLQCINLRSVVDSINISSPGNGYQNKKRTCQPIGINTSSDTINIVDHDYLSGEIVKYTSDDTSIGGLSSGSEYYILKVDDNNFKLSDTDPKDFNNTYINLTTSGIGTHNFNYQDISVNITGTVGISSCKIQPIFRGNISSVHLSDGGVGYGSSEIINFEKNPIITLSSGTGAQLSPIISHNTQSIIEVFVSNSGENYDSSPNIEILQSGAGVGAILVPVVEDGKIISVKVLEGGSGYSSSTVISVNSTGQDEILKPVLQKWNINLFEKYFSQITEDDGYLTVGNNRDYGLQYSHIYAPRNLRELVFSVDQEGNKLYNQPDLNKNNSIEVNSQNHSPIIGWAYDGNPIYGPYGYSNINGGNITQMRSGYKLEYKSQRPSLDIFPEGFFIEDYTHYKTTEERFLDKNNGRFCITPEFPNGTYAYFSTLNDNIDSSGPFSKYKRPEFPYLIGSYNNSPIQFNFEATSNQDYIDINNSSWCRNTAFYNLIEENVNYDYLSIPNNLSQTINIDSVYEGNISSVGIITGGKSYAVGDIVGFSGSLYGNDCKAKVSTIEGKQVSNISVATTSIEDVEITQSDICGEYVLRTELPHQFENLDDILISGIVTTTSPLINGSYSANISKKSFKIVGFGTQYNGIGSVGETGIVTYFSVKGNLDSIRENDILSIEDEKIKVLNIEPKSYRIRVLREFDNTVGTSHSSSSYLIENPRTIRVRKNHKKEFKSKFNFKANKELYFNPKESVGIGTSGIGVTLPISNPGTASTEIFVALGSIYINKHDLEDGDLLTYFSHEHENITYVDDDFTDIKTLQDNQQVFVQKNSDDSIGISTLGIGLTSLYFVGIGTGNYHSFKTNYNGLTSRIDRNLVSVTTTEDSLLEDGDVVDIEVIPSLSTNISVKYNDYNRRLIINPIDFNSIDVNLTNNTIEIKNHNLSTGDKVIYTSNSPSTGLENNAIYYIIRINPDLIKLSSNAYNSSILNAINIQSVSDGTINPINPSIEIYKDSVVTFDMSDSSLSYQNLSVLYPAFELNFYKDSSFTEIWKKSDESSKFKVEKSGSVGIDSTAYIKLIVTSNVPKILYYRLDPVYNSSIPIEKEFANVDNDFKGSSQILIKNSNYNGKHIVSRITSTGFKYTIKDFAENSAYDSINSKISYITNSKNANGSINDIKVLNPGSGYDQLSTVKYISSINGTDAILKSFSSSIGTIQKFKINDIGYDFPSDTTLKPSFILPQTLRIDRLYSIDSIDIVSSGNNYLSSPKLLVFDGETNKNISDIDIEFDIKKLKVDILKNNYGMSALTPYIIPIENTNGVGISSISYNSSTKDVTVTLDTSFSDTQSFPIKVNDKVLIENVSVGIGSTSRGYNSSEYEYKLFTITSTNENLGGFGATVTYNISEYFTDSISTPGNFDSVSSVARIIPEKDFPIFNIILKSNDYYKGETVLSKNIEGVVSDWNSRSGILKVNSKNKFTSGSIIVGVVSKSKATISSNVYENAYLNLSSSADISKGSQTISGYLNDNMQRIQDSNYYQNFSYSLKSRVPYDIWNEPVSSLNHTVGFKKYCDYQMESLPKSGSLSVGLSTHLTHLNTVNNLYEVLDLGTKTDYDLVSENYINLNKKVISNEIVFSSKILNDYSQSIGNLVIPIDDISKDFNSNPRSTEYSIIDEFNLSEKTFIKYLTFIRDKRYTKQRQFMFVDLIHDNSFGYINQYGRVETSYDQGSFDFSISGDKGQLLFWPYKSKINDYDVVVASYSLDDTMVGVGSTTIGNSLIINNQTPIVSTAATTIVSIGNTYSSAKVLLQLTEDISSNEYEFNELNVIHNGSIVELSQYGPLSTNNINHSSGLGTYFAYIDNESLKIDFIPKVGIVTGGVINSFVIGMGNSLSSPTQEYKTSNNNRIESITNSYNSIGISTTYVIAEYSSTQYNSGYFIIQVSDVTNNQYQLSEFIVIDDYVDDISTTEVYSTEYGNIETLSGIGSFGTQIVDNSGPMTQILFTPPLNVDININVYMNIVGNGNTTTDSGEIKLTSDLSVDSTFGNYEGTNRDVKKRFDLKYNDIKIFVSEFDANDPSIVDLNDNSIIIPNHLFVSGELIKYIPPSVGNEIGIVSTTFSGIGNTDKLPSDVFAVKVDTNKLQLASSAENALKTTPEIIEFSSVGIETNHILSATNQNSKVLISIDGIVQSPIVSTSSTTITSQTLSKTQNSIQLNDASIFNDGDLVKIGDEIMIIDYVNTTGSNYINVRRSWLGTELLDHSSGSIATKVSGTYNITNNILNFVEAPKGNIPFGTSTNYPDDRDWSGISSPSSFSGRVFLQSGTKNSSDQAYSKNYIYDDISSQFNYINNDFILTSNGSDVSGIYQENPLIFVNQVLQRPNSDNIVQIGSYDLSESVGRTTISFTGNSQQIKNDVGISSFPRGGQILSVNPNSGFGYQPLVSAGGTCIISVGGTIQSISIGNSGSGYRSGIQTVNVGVKTSGSELVNIGTANINNGYISGISISNPGTGYTTSNPPIVIIDSPLPYENIPLIYHNTSSGIGSESSVDIVVGQGSSIIDFKLKTTGYGYDKNDLLTIEIGGATGIPTTNNSYSDFTLEVDQIFKDSFSAWSIGSLKIMDSIHHIIDGKRKTFNLKYQGNPFAILKKPGFIGEHHDLLIIFINGILQTPRSSYMFDGGSTITFSEPLIDEDDVIIMFYQGNASEDVVLKEEMYSIEIGDSLQICNDASIGQSLALQETNRIISSSETIDVVGTFPYFGPGNVSDASLMRPITLTKQRNDLIINGKNITKDREYYEPFINPLSYIINSVGSGSTEVYVDKVRPLFDNKNESDVSLEFQNNVTLMNQGISNVGASATALVSSSGLVTGLEFSDFGFGYTSPPEISISLPIGISTTNTRATASGVIGNGGQLIGATITDSGLGYDPNNPPLVIISTPVSYKESLNVLSYEGDDGNIVGFGTTTTTVVGVGTTGLPINLNVGTELIFDFHIPYTSHLRNTEFVGTAVTINSLSQNDYFIISDSYVSVAGMGTFLSVQNSGGRIGICTQFIDSVFNVKSSEIVQKDVAGISTNISRITTKIIKDSRLTNLSSNVTTFDSNQITFDDGEDIYSGIITDSDTVGNYSWGKIVLNGNISNNFVSHTDNINGISGINTSDIVMRTHRIKY